ncbi:neural cell expressed [Nannochloropsis oceanica]
MSSRQGYSALSEEHYVDVEAPAGAEGGSQVINSPAIPTATVAPSPIAASPASTIGALKLKVQTVAGVPPPQQRLIFAGRMLQDQQTLQSCNIQPGCVIHLFARPPPPPPGAPGSIASIVGPGAPGANGGEGGVAIGPGTHLNPFGLPSSFGDPELLRSTHSVKLFSSCLVAICAMQLLLLSLQLVASWSMGGGTEGRGGEVPPIPGGDDDNDGVSEEKGAEEIGAVFVLQVMMNILGLYVGLVGIRSANTLQLQSSKIYLYGLLVVGTAWMATRIIWAINSVTSGYDVDVGPTPSSTPPDSPSNGTDAGGGDSDGGGDVEYQQMDRGELIYMVSLSCFLYSLVWGVCFFRASQFYTLVRRANGLGP